MASPTRPGRVVVDALAARYGGTAYAAIQVGRRLGAPDRPAVVVAREGSLVAQGLRGAETVQTHLLRHGVPGELVRRVGWQALQLPAVAAGQPLLTWSGLLPRRAGRPLVSYLANPVMFSSPRAADRLRRAAARRTSGWSAHVLVPTDAMARLASPHLRRAAETVPLGVDHERFRPAAEPGEEVLCVADGYAHKRHDLVLAAWSRLPHPRPVLRLVGDFAVDRGAAPGLERAIARASLEGTVVVESRLRLGELVDAYARARVFVVASEQESFCMPLLEAQACGVPAVARDLASLRETGGVGTRYVGGDRAEEWAAALATLLSDGRAHAEARDAALEHAARYSWERTASAIRERLLTGPSAA